MSARSVSAELRSPSKMLRPSWIRRGSTGHDHRAGYPSSAEGSRPSSRARENRRLQGRESGKTIGKTDGSSVCGDDHELHGQVTLRRHQRTRPCSRIGSDRSSIGAACPVHDRNPVAGVHPQDRERRRDRLRQVDRWAVDPVRTGDRSAPTGFSSCDDRRDEEEPGRLQRPGDAVHQGSSQGKIMAMQRGIALSALGKLVEKTRPTTGAHVATGGSRSASRPSPRLRLKTRPAADHLQGAQPTSSRPSVSSR